MTAAEIRTEIDALKKTVRYSPSAKANVAAMKIVGLQHQLDSLGSKKVDL